MRTPRATFPVAEGIGVFVGIIAWDLFNDGHLELIKAIAIAAPCSLNMVWHSLLESQDDSKRTALNRSHQTITRKNCGFFVFGMLHIVTQDLNKRNRQPL